MSEELQKEQQPKKQLWKDKKMFLIGGVIVLFFIAVLFLKGNPDTKEEQEVQYPIVYLKENTLYSYDLGGEPQEIDYIRVYKTSEEDNSVEDEYIYSTKKGLTLSQDRQRLFYKNKITDTNFQLCYTDLKTGKNKIVAEEVINYDVSPDGTYCVYQVQTDEQSKTNSYIYDVKNGKEILVEDNLFEEQVVVYDDDYSYINETNRYFNIEEQCIIYEKLESRENENKSSKVSLQMLSFGGGETKTIAENVFSNIVFMPEVNKLYFMKDGKEDEKESYSLYEYDFKKEPVLIEEKMNYTIIPLKNKKDIIYAVKKEEKIKFADLVEDDKKSDNESLRKDLENKDYTYFTYDFYLYSNGKSTKVCSDATMLFASVEGLYDDLGVLDDDGQYLIFGRTNAFDEKIKLSEVSSLEEIEDIYWERQTDSTYDIFLSTPQVKEGIQVSTGRLAELPKLSKSKDRLFIEQGAEKEEEAYSHLIFVQLDNSKKEVKTTKDLGENTWLYNFDGEKDEAIYTIRDLYTDELALYYGVEGAERLSKDIRHTSLNSDTKETYFVEEKTGKSGDLKKLKNGEIETIEKNVFDFIQKGDTIIYRKNQQGFPVVYDIYLFDGENSVKIDTEVTKIF